MASSSSGSALNYGLSPYAQSYFVEELQQFEKKKSQEMQLKHEALKAKMNKSLNEVQKLLKHPSFQNAAVPCNSAKSTKPAVVCTKNEGKSTSNNEEMLTKDDIEGTSGTKMEEIKIPNANSERKQTFLKKGSGLQKYMGKPISYPKKAEEIKIPNTKSRSPKPFLKRGSGLQKYMGKPISYPKRAVSKEQDDKETAVPSSNNLKSQRPVFCKNVANTVSQKPRMRYVDFCLPNEKISTPTIIASELKPSTSHSSRNNSIQTEKSYFKEKYQLAENAGSGNQTPDKISLPQYSTKTATVLDYESSVPSHDFLTFDLASLRERKIELEKQLQSCDEELNQFESSDPSTEMFIMSPSSNDWNATSNPHTMETAPLDASIVHKSKPSSSITATQDLMRENVDKMARDIKIYERKNADLAKLEKRQEEELRIIRKYKEDFQKFKQVELAKLNQEIYEKEHEVRRERYNYELCQKLKFGFPNRKEREEIAKLQQELESIREQLKKKMPKSNAETKHLQYRLSVSERKNENLRNRLAGKEDELAKWDNQNHVNQQSIPNAETKGKPSLVEIDPKRKNSYNHNGITKDVDESECHEVSPEGHSSSYKEIQDEDCMERLYDNGDIETFYPSGTRKFITENGLHIKYEYFNGDIQEIFPDKRKVYTHSHGVVERIYPNELKVAEFPDGQVEKHYPDGSKEITTPSGKFITEHPNGIQEIRTPDGVKTTIFLDRTQIVEFPSGDKETRTLDFIKREFPNGAIKTVYRTGRTETKLPNGRHRIKDRDGNVLFDNSVACWY